MKAHMGISPRSKEEAEEIESDRLRSAFLKKKYESIPEEEKNRRIKRLERIFKERIVGIPEQDREVLVSYWLSQTVTVNGVVKKAPVLKLDGRIIVPSSKGGRQAAAAVNREGTCFMFDYGLLFAPEEVIEEVFAHELGHAFFRASNIDFLEGEITPTVAETYTKERHAEEQAVRDKVKQWGLTKEYLIAIWEVAVEIGKDDWKQIYKKEKLHVEKNGI